MPASGQYKIRKLRKSDGSGPEATSLGLPTDIASKLPDDVRFTVELTDDGILYRPIKPSVKPSEIPEWVSEFGGAGDKNGGSTERPKPKAKPAASASS